jgi:arylsulfatase A-like enzyme
VRIVLLSALWTALPTAAFARPESVPGDPNVVLIVIDTLRADHLPFYGYPIDTAPFLSDLAARGVVFSNAFSTSAWTAPAAASLFTSLDPVQHGVEMGRNATRLLRKRTGATITLNRIPEELEILPEAMASAGYRTFAVADNFNISEEMGFAQGFDAFQTAWYKGGARVNEILREWRREITGGGKYFLYIHYVDPHGPYKGHAPTYRKQEDPERDRIARYDSEIAYVDRLIREAFRKYDWERNTLILVTSDHGEEFLDHGRHGHDKTLFSEIVRVPLLAFYPAGGVGPARVADHVSLVDVLPTLREFAGLPRGEHDLGLSLLPLMTRTRDSWTSDRRLYARLNKKSADPARGVHLRAVTHGRWRYITSPEGREWLFDIDRDPGEQRNVVDRHRELADSLRADLDRFDAAVGRHATPPVEMTVSPEEIEKLEALGYAE